MLIPKFNYNHIDYIEIIADDVSLEDDNKYYYMKLNKGDIISIQITEQSGWIIKLNNVLVNNSVNIYYQNHRIFWHNIHGATKGDAMLQYFNNKAFIFTYIDKIRENKLKKLL